ncbi:signal peptidase II [Rubrobacter indicoceani]|uniref:signal peptidase II n=1 Tax=Rubrobacter indicoceani TaxID=2051957 RepID=UPI0013C42D31|nr:signal peptidase II [Rubrobacter indicoceani]
MQVSSENPVRKRRQAKGRMTVLPALALATSVFVVDQVLKFLVERTMSLNESITLIPGLLSLTYIHNDGGAFGILGGSQILLLAGSVIAVLVVLWMLVSGPPSRLTTVACGLILGGAAGNLADRLSSGYVTDYVHFDFWYIFNAADVAIVSGVLLLLFCSLLPPRRSP